MSFIDFIFIGFDCYIGFNFIGFFCFIDFIFIGFLIFIVFIYIDLWKRCNRLIMSAWYKICENPPNFPKYWLFRQISKSSINDQKWRFCKKVAKRAFLSFLWVGIFPDPKRNFEKMTSDMRLNFFSSPPVRGGCHYFVTFM